MLRFLWRGLVGLVTIIVVLAGVVVALGWHYSTPIPASLQQRLEMSPHYGMDRFLNEEPETPFEFTWEALVRMLTNEAQVTPPGELPVVPFDTGTLAQPPAPGLRATWLGHASVLVEIDGVRVLTDPVFDERTSPVQFLGPLRFHPVPFALASLAGIDAVLISHNHYDHLDEASIKHLATTATEFYVPLGLSELLAQWGVPTARIHGLDWGEEAEVGGVRLVATPARHYSNRGLFDTNRTQWSSWSVIGPVHRVFFSGDSGYSAAFREQVRDLGPFDLTMIKIAAYGPGQAWMDVHMDPEEAVRAHDDMDGVHMLPVAWGTFNLAEHAWDEPIIRAVAAADASGASLLTPRLGETVDINDLPAFTAWWEEVR